MPGRVPLLYTDQVVRRARAIIAGALLAAGRAGAQNADGVLLGPEASLTGGAVLATTHDAAGAYYNPAGLAGMSGSSLQFSGSAYQVSALRLRSFVRTNLPWTTVDQTLSTSDWATLASVAAYGFRISPALGVALGVWVPVNQSIAVVSSVDSAGPFTASGTTVQVDYRQRIALTQRIQRTYLGAAAGVSARPGLRIGSGLFLVYERAEQFFDLFAGAQSDGGDANAATATLSTRGAPSQLAARAIFGAQWDLSAAWSVGLTVRTPTVALATFGDITTVRQFASLLPGTTPAVGFSQELNRQPGIDEPWRVAVGNAVAVAGLSLRAELDWQAPRAGSRAVVNGRVGLYRVVTDDLAWGTGLFTDRSREDVRSGALSVDYYGVAAGLDYRLAQVRAARQPGASWDVRTSLAVRYAFGIGEVERLEANALVAPGATPPSTARVIAHSLSVNIGALLVF